MTLNFWRMCTANLLLFISVYMLFPLLPFVMGEQLGVSVGQAGSMFLVFAVAMFAVGPFHAYLVDEYKRKHVLLYSVLIMLAAVLGYAFVDGYTKFLAACRCAGSMFRAGNHSGHYGGHRHNDFRAPQRRKHGICMGCTLGHAGGCCVGHWNV